MERKFSNYFLGLDIGTDSVGWCVADHDYKVLKYKGNAMWGVSLFDEAHQAADRRSFRTSRRRLDRKKQRRTLLQELFASEIAKIDPDFFIRRRESALLPEDRTIADGSVFGGDISDRQLHEKYPTIHHIIYALMNEDFPHDVRLVYLACEYLITHRGHFLFDVDADNVDKVTDISGIMAEFYAWFDSQELERPFDCDDNEFGAVLTADKRITERVRGFKNLLWNGKNPDDEEYPIDRLVMIKLISGAKAKLSDLFKNADYKENEHNELSLGSGDFDELLAALSSEIDGDEAELVRIMKALFDWSQLVNILNGHTFISEAKVGIYEKHKSDLALLKRFVKKYLPEKYSEVFRKADEKLNNYVKYSANLKNADIGSAEKFPKCTAEDFCKYIRALFKSVIPEGADKPEFDRMMTDLEENSFCPKQVTGGNCVIPYQLYYIELKKILENAQKYLPFLEESDQYGTTAKKILSIMTFRVPYYVGPLVRNNSSHAWIERKAGKIYPWNFEEMVDLDKSEDMFIRKMTATCTYAAGEDVLPKNSLLYSSYMVLNEINNIRINGVRIDPLVKQGVYENVFMKHRKVTLKKIRDYLSSVGAFSEGTDKLDGIDVSVKSSLRSYLDFRPFIDSGKLTSRQAEEIIARITATTDKARLKKWLRNYGLEEADIVRMAGFGYKDYGRLSEKFLNGIREIDTSTGEIVGGTIIEQLWSGSENLMELLSEKHSYAAQLEEMNREYYSDKQRSISDRLTEMYVPAAARRAVIRTMDIVSEIRSLTGCAPEKIFVEMARDHTDKDKGKRTISRKEQVRNYLKNIPETDELMKQLDSRTEGELRGDKLYLYFMQLGRCMYSGEPIDIESLPTKDYDIDHIFPQSRIKDDSLDNRVLVKSEINQSQKKDIYPIDGGIRQKMRGFWDMLHKNKLVSDKKYERLIRSTPFTDEELADFINRQLVETRQSTKAVATLLKEMFPDSSVVYVKAGIVSEFRHEFDLLKCREVNDLHHAKDAYLNIVMGQVYDVKFTRSPISFIKESGSSRNYSMKLSSLLAHDISRGDVVAWRKGETLDNVKRQMTKNNIRYVRYSLTRKGGLFDQMPLRKGHGQVPRKAGLDTENYGGYQNPAISHFYLVKYQKGKNSVISLIPVELRAAGSIRSVGDISDYCRDYLKMGSVSVLLGGRKIKINTLFEIDGFRVHLSSRSNDSIWFKGGMQLVLPQEYEAYAKKIYSYCEKCSEAAKFKADIPAVTKYDKLTSEQNEALYDLLLDKLENTSYHVLMDTPLKVLKGSRDMFRELPVEQQTLALSHIIELFGCTNPSGKDLTIINGSKSSGILKMSMALNAKRFSDIRIIDQSPTGLIEHRSENLLEL